MVDKIWYNMEELIGGSEERVLIETYWNVKENDLVFLKNSFAVLIETYWNVKSRNDWINRLLSCINRNILECKGGISIQIRKRNSVLIETYWNVKAINSRTSESSPIVLIETYWNVKAYPI